MSLTMERLFMAGSTKLFIGLLATCFTPTIVVSAPPPSATATLIPTPDQTAAEKINPTDTVIKQLLSENKKYSSDTISFYKENGYLPVWMSGNGLNKFGQVALDVLKNAASEGLNPEDYTQTLTALQKKFSPEEIDIILTNEFIHYIDDVRVGRIPPSHAARIIKIISPKTVPVKLIQEALQDSTGEKLRQMAPDLPDYQALKKALQHYAKLVKENPDLPQITKKTLKVGEKNDDIPKLRVILQTLGDYKGTDLTSNIFDKDLETAVKQFQKRYFINETSVVSDQTRKALNKPLKNLLNKIIINMERLRWLPDENADNRHILVNVAGYEVKAYTKNHLDLRIKAIVGKTATKTPLFYAPMKNIIINPSWGVPHSILMRDKLPKILQDPSYIQRAGFTIYNSNGETIDPDQADWAHEGASYRLRQHPGARNALGRIKLNIENPYTIYLHGTPEEKLFQKTVRNFSSGCIRLEDPAALASWILHDSEKYSVESLDKMVNKGTTVTVPLKEQINVYFTYQTIWQGEDDILYISPDAYNLDPLLEKLLKIDLKSELQEEKSSKTRLA